MAGSVRVIGLISHISQSTGQLPTHGEVIVQYRVTGEVIGEITGEVVVQVDFTQAEAQISSDVRTLLAAYVEPRIFPPQGFGVSDVRGCNL